MLRKPEHPSLASSISLIPKRGVCAGGLQTVFCEDEERRELRHLQDHAKYVNIVGVCVSQQRMEQACGSVSL